MIEHLPLDVGYMVQASWATTKTVDKGSTVCGTSHMDIKKSNNDFFMFLSPNPSLLRLACVSSSNAQNLIFLLNTDKNFFISQAVDKRHQVDVT